MALSACGLALSLPSAGMEGDTTPFDYAHDKQVLASPTPTEVPTPMAEATSISKNWFQKLDTYYRCEV